MEIRQEQILAMLVEEYIKTAEPVGSQILVRNYKLDVSPATVRNEMVELEEGGYLEQPHTSAGRVPTDKAYRFFVNKISGGENLTEKEYKSLQKSLQEIRKISREYRSFVKNVSRLVSDLSQDIGIFGILEENDFHAAGLSNLFKKPEFHGNEEAFDFLDIFDSLDKEFGKIFERIENEAQVFIGKENIINDFDEFSLVVSRCRAKKCRKGVVGILGPKRMDYGKNIALVDSIRELIDEF
jgi:heat-inducible transcriptional repressor